MLDGVVEEGIRIIQLGRQCLVAHFFHHDHGGFLVQHLVDGDHGTHLHQGLDHLGGLDCHLVGQIGHGNGFGHVHFTHDGFGRRLEGMGFVVAAAMALAMLAAATAPAAVGIAATGLETGTLLVAVVPAAFLLGTGLGVAGLAGGLV